MEHIDSIYGEEDICFFCLEGEIVTPDGSPNPLLDHQNLFPCTCKIKVHSRCLETWLGYKDCCPVCKTEVDREEGEQEPEPYTPPSLGEIDSILRNHQDPRTTIHLLRPPPPPSSRLLSRCERLFLLILVLVILILFVFPGLQRLGINL